VLGARDAKVVLLVPCERVRILFQGGEKLLTELQAEDPNR
jgi:hypothetical protein